MLSKLISAAFALVILLAAPPMAAQASVPTPTAAPSGQIPIADFARIPFMSQPELSPDGASLAALTRVEGTQIITLLSLAKTDEKPVYLRLPENTQVGWIRWINKDNLLVGLYALQTVDLGERWHISRLIGVHRPTGKVTKILWDSKGQNAADLLWTANDGSPDILVAAQNSIYRDEEFWPDVWRVNVQTGKKKQVLQGRDGVNDWYADAAGNVRAGISYNPANRRFRLLYRETGEGAFRTIDTAEGKKEESLLSPFMFLPGTNNAYAYHDDDKGRTAIFEVDLLTRKDLRTVFAAPAGGEVDGAQLSDDRKTLLGAGYSGKSNGFTWFDPELAKVQAEMEKAAPGRRLRIISMTADHSRLLVRVDRPNNPGIIYYYDIGSGKMQVLALVNEAIGSKSLAPVWMVEYSARDGLKIEAVLTLPRDRPATNLPIVMMPHGGPWAHDTLDYDYWPQFLASRGYAVLQPNFRGSTGYGTDFLRKGEGQMGLAMQDDITDGLAWAVKSGLADPKRACIVGASYGGYAAMWGIAKDPDLYRCGVSIAGVANLRREVNDFGNALRGKEYRDSWQRMTPDFAAVSPINAVGRIKVPLLLVHGKKDITVDVVQSSSMASKMRGAGKQVELVVLPEADHSFTREADRVTLLTALEAFLLKHNPPDPAAVK
jgi:dipeptidyl aminopeptidase/acylaminoacyl peptidase